MLKIIKSVECSKGGGSRVDFQDLPSIQALLKVYFVKRFSTLTSKLWVTLLKPYLTTLVCREAFKMCHGILKKYFILLSILTKVYVFQGF